VSEYRVLTNADSGVVLLARARWCANYWCHLRGLMFRRHLPEDEGLLFVYGRESVVESAIHMLFMWFAIGAVWLDKEGRVVDKVLARPWHPAYASHRPAQYVIEARPSLLDRVQVGDRIAFDRRAT
jgi:uncharacterized membrane protein (UPF0127 family)